MSRWLRPSRLLKSRNKKLDALKKETKTAKAAALTAREIKAMGKKNPITGNFSLTQQESVTLKKYAVSGLSARAEIAKLREQLAAAEQAATVWKRRFDALHEKYEALKKKTQPYLAALKAAPEKIRAFINTILAQSKDSRQTHINYERNRKEDALDR